ncbi:MAG: hypothetical protein V3S68_00915 [Dehalococcoidia bacterium]
MAIELDDLTKEDFEAYEEVRASGAVNMVSSAAKDLTGLDKDVLLAVAHNYSKLMKIFPDVRGSY